MHILLIFKIDLFKGTFFLVEKFHYFDFSLHKELICVRLYYRYRHAFYKYQVITITLISLIIRAHFPDWYIYF